MSSRERAFTLLEVVFTVALVAFLASAVAYVYVVTLRSWHNLGHRTDLHEKLHFGLESVIREVRKADAILIKTDEHAIRFTLNEGGTDNNYIYYLYNNADGWPLSFKQSTYELRRASMTAGALNTATFKYENGEFILPGLVPPPKGTSITSAGSGKVASIQLMGIEGSDTLTVRGYVRIRNAA